MIPTPEPVASWQRWALLLTGLVVGITSIWVASRGPAFSYAGSSPFAVVAALTPGWALVAVGIAAWIRHPDSRFGWLLAIAGIAWFLVEWPNPASAGSVMFSIGLVLHSAHPAFVAHAAFAFRSGQQGWSVARAIVAAAYLTNVVGLGLIPALFFNPGAARCPACPDNLFAVGSNLDVVSSTIRLGLALEAMWSATSIVIVVHSLIRATPAVRRPLAPILLPAAAFLVFVAAGAIHAIPRGSLSNDSVDLGLWYGQAGALVALAGGVALERIRARRARLRVAQVAVDLAVSPPTGQLRAALAAALGDPSLRIAYVVGEGRISDLEGHPVDIVANSGQTLTRVEAGHSQVAIVSHRSDLLDDPERLTEAIAAARLSIENERLHAATQAQLEDLRASRARIIDAADSERRRLERDLHDGAQQRLVTLSMGLGLARLQLGNVDSAEAARVAAVDNMLREALAGLREIAHGIYPMELGDGLAAGMAALAETAPIPIHVLEAPGFRCDPRIEAAGYFVIAEVSLHAGTTKASVRAKQAHDRLVIDVEAEGSGPINIVGLEDRVGAFDGTISLASEPGGRVHVHAELPCAS